MEKLTKEDLIKALAKAAAPTRPRKKAERNEEQQKELTERLAKMRVTLAENRAKKSEAKKNIDNSTENAPTKIQAALHLAGHEKEDIFEKKYGSTFEKMTETLGRLENHFSDIKQMKISKAEQRKQEKEKAEQSTIKIDIKERSIDIPTPQPQLQRPREVYNEPVETPQSVPIKQYVAPLPLAQLKFNDFNKMSFGKKRN